MTHEQKFERWVASGAGLYVDWCNGQRMTVRKLSAIHNWIKRQLWAELESESEDTSERRRLEDVLKLLDHELESKRR